MCLGEERSIGSFQVIVPPELVKSGPKDVRVTFDIDKYGLVHIASSQLMDEFFEEVKTDAPEGKILLTFSCRLWKLIALC